MIMKLYCDNEAIVCILVHPSHRVHQQSVTFFDEVFLLRWRFCLSKSLFISLFAEVVRKLHCAEERGHGRRRHPAARLQAGTGLVTGTGAQL